MTPTYCGEEASQKLQCVQLFSKPVIVKNPHKKKLSTSEVVSAGNELVSFEALSLRALSPLLLFNSAPQSLSSPPNDFSNVALGRLFCTGNTFSSFSPWTSGIELPLIQNK